jgi:zinc D-Ala-D-Ala dipeptidase
MTAPPLPAMPAPSRQLAIEVVPGHPDFIALGALAGVRVDLRYASANNLMGRPLYGSWDCAWLHREAALGLKQAVAWLAQQHPGWQLCVLDALRPQRVQEALWAEVVGTPMQPYFANPVAGSIHSFGMAVDVTLLELDTGQELDMGSGFDDTREESHPEFESRLLAQGRLSSHQLAHRLTLRQAMAEGGFSGIATEWWHFDCGDKRQVRQSFARVV